MPSFISVLLTLVLAPLAVPVLYIVYKLLVWKKYRDLAVKSGVPPLYPEVANSPLGSMMLLNKNWGIMYDFKLQRLQDISPTTLTAFTPQMFTNPHPTINTIDPEIVRYILKDNFDNYLKPDFFLASLNEVIGDGIFGLNHGPHSADKGEMWTLQRKTAAKVFSKHNFNTKMYSSFARHTAVLKQVIDSKLAAGEQVIDMQTLMFQFTLDSFGEIGFGTELNSLVEDSDFGRAFDRASEICLARLTKPFWDSPLGKYLYSSELEMDALVKKIDVMIYGMIKHKREHPTELGDDILSLFIQESLGLTDRELREVSIGLLTAGRDTTAAALSFALGFLVQYPEWQQRVYEEICEKRKTCADEAIPLKELASMKQLHAVMMETLRLRPSVPSDTKQAAQDDVLPGGFKIPKGTRVTFEVYMMGHSPQIWGDDCVEFKPERWLKMDKLPSPYTFPVFQAGPRVCLGESMAKFEIQLVLAYLVERYRFSVPAGVDAQSITYAAGITLKVKDGLNLVVEKRE